MRGTRRDQTTSVDATGSWFGPRPGDAQPSLACRKSTVRVPGRAGSPPARGSRAGSPRCRTRGPCPDSTTKVTSLPMPRSSRPSARMASTGKKSSSSAKWPSTGAVRPGPVRGRVAERRAVVRHGGADAVALLRGDDQRQHAAHAEADDPDCVAGDLRAREQVVDRAAACRARRGPSAARSSARRPCPSRCARRSHRGTGPVRAQRTRRRPGGRTRP